MRRPNSIPFQIIIAALLTVALPVQANTSVHIAYHWHLHQPIYWPDYKPGLNRYQFAKDSVDLKLANTGNYYAGSPFEHPRNQLVNGDGGTYDEVFTKADRVGAYQAVPKNSIATILSFPDAGAQISYSGALQENIWSFGSANSYGYASNWNSHNTTAQGWTTSGGKPRADMVGMTYHHAFSPLIPKTVLRKEIQIFKEIWWKSWDGNSNLTDHSKGFWPPEAAFSTTIIPVLASEGYNWVIVPNSHLARTCQNYIQVATKGTSGWNIDPPNGADVLGPTVASNQWWSGQLDGRGGVFPAPYAYQAHKAKYVDPNTGMETRITIVPMCDLLSYMNGFATMDTSIIPSKIAPWNDPNKPSLVLMAHDGDNSWGGGNSYYSESVPQFTQDSVNKGYHPTTIEQFLADWPVSDSDVVHIEDGAWFNAANDWGHPQFINWLYPPARSTTNPLYNASDPLTFFDLETPGWTEDWRNWAVLIAGANFCETAEQMTISNGGTVQARKIQEPYQKNGTYNNPNEAERAWHFYLGGLDSGFMYYGIAIDDEVKQSLACNRAVQLAKIITDANPNLDQTPPTVFKPQRFPWNPGGMGWGQLTHYIEVGFNNKPPWPSDFYIWTHVFDVSGVSNVTLYVRQDNDGVNPLSSNQNETYAGGSEVGAWVPLAMTKRTISKTQGDNGGAGEPDQGINFFIQPDYIADYYWTKVTGYKDKLLDYYIEATDNKGNVTKADIQHVYVAAGGGGGPTNGCNGRVCVSPAPPVAGNPVTITFSPAGGPLTNAAQVYIHLGWNNWAIVLADATMTLNASNRWEYTTTVTNIATQLDCVFNNGAGTWDNNSGADWHFAVTSTPQLPPTPGSITAAPVSATEISVSWGASSGATGYVVKRDSLQVATTSVTSYTDGGLVTGSNYCYTVAATNNVGTSADSAPACTSISGPPPPQNLTAAGVATNQINLAWSASAGAVGYIIERGSSPIATTSATNYSDTGLSPNTQYCYMIAATNGIGSSLFSSPTCATTLELPPPSFVLNGIASNYPGYLLNSPGMTLYVAVRGTTLYVATWSPGSNGPNDHFILVSDQILASPTTSSPWAKTGGIAIPLNKVMLTAESQGIYTGWQNLNGSSATASNQAMKAPATSGQLQGIINLAQAFGSIPSTLFLSAAAYTTANAGNLVAQAPAGNANLNIESNEFLAVPVVTIIDSAGNGSYDYLDPLRLFAISVVQATGNGFAVSWPSVPGKAYQLMYCGTLDGAWSSNGIPVLTGSSGQSSMTYTDITATAVAQRFYKVKLAN